MEDHEAQDSLTQWEQLHSPFSQTNLPWNIEALHRDNHFLQNPQTESLPIVPLEESELPPSSSSASSSSTPPPPPAPALSTLSSTNLKSGGGDDDEAAAFLISLLYLQWRRRRALAPRDPDKERLVLLLREKNKIGQPMVRIAEMDEALLARRRVSVIRVG